MKLKRALVSVSDKTGLVELLKPLVIQGMEVVSTGGTAQHLKANGIHCLSVSDITHFPEVMGGRVKTLHPKIHMSILARDNEEDMQLLEQHGLKMFDLVVCNLYPFEQVSAKSGVSEAELIENIDIGGPTILRAAAKNFKSVIVLSDPKDYELFSSLKEAPDLQMRKTWAAKVFEQTSKYDALIAATLIGDSGFIVQGGLVQKLRYGENAHQEASWFFEKGQGEGLHHAMILQGKELSYNNLLDLEAACALVRLFKEPAVVAVKHNNPCGVSSDSSPIVALKKAVSSDPVSVFGGILAVNVQVTAEMAHFLGDLFLECLIAPEISDEAKDVFSKKKNLRILIWKNMNQFFSRREIKSISGGYLQQTTDCEFGSIEKWDFMGHKVSSPILEDFIFGEKVCAYQKSNAIAVVKNQTTLGLGMGQVNRIDALELAIGRWKKFHPEISDPILVSDAFFPFSDSLELAHKNGIQWILQPGGSVRDTEIREKAQQLGLKMVLSGVRHFKH